MIKNNAEFSPGELAAIFGERHLHNFQEEFRVKGVSIDTRAIDEGNIFVAIKGENVDAHEKIQEAFANGAIAVVVNRDKFDEIIALYEDKPIIAVDDTTEALGRLANLHRRRFDFPVIAVGGSNGKTTTKEMIASVLSQKFSVLKTFENFNNQIGVPLMLLQFSNAFDIAVLEIGTNQPGEIAILSEMVQPTHGLITNIGKEHLEQLIDIDGVEFEETFLFGYLRARGVCFINDDDERLRRYPEVVERYRRYGTAQSVETRGEITLNDDLSPNLKIFFEDKSIEVRMKTMGIASAKNALAAAAVGFSFELSEDEVKAGLESFEPIKEHGYGRMDPQYCGGMLIINDTYNANPSSMMLALDNLAEIRREGEKIAILADMRELGASADEEHLAMLKYAADKVEPYAGKVLITGEEFLKASAKVESPYITAFDTKSDLINYAINNIDNTATVLIKASRGLKMEEVVRAIKEHFKPRT